ncbi:GntR family transcriptional regulator [Parasphingopyxis marina]|uniref:GntR family transcriptional regulator n=1 Tax=Parasphingopyxis marina TaxID=2761622 RepID=A0A842I3F3_9SPHN|nr:GntR family transcriptional regulator [Parasphingopyxis marina]MBC2778920.1 GntR family transcriptional regulator [Parasphingopyxis marina]
MLLNLADDNITKKRNKAKSTNMPLLIADRIRSAIVKGQLAPGVHLGQMQIAEQFTASRVPVREALKLLAAEGIIVHDPNRGFFVAAISASEAQQLYRLRHLLEGELLKSIPWPDKTQLAALETRIEELEQLLKKGDRPSWVLRHREFHKALFELSDRDVIVRECLRMWMLTDRYRSLLPGPQASGDERRGPTDERKILAALKAKDRAKLLEVVERDRQRVEQLILEVFANRDS